MRCFFNILNVITNTLELKDYNFKKLKTFLILTLSLNILHVFPK